MKKLIAALAVLPLSGCVTPGGTPFTIDPQAVSVAVQAICAAQVPAVEIASLLTASPYLGGVEAIATVICKTIIAQQNLNPPVVTPPLPPLPPPLPSTAARRGFRAGVRAGARLAAPQQGAIILNGVTLHFTRP